LSAQRFGIGRGTVQVRPLTLEGPPSSTIHGRKPVGRHDFFNLVTASLSAPAAKQFLLKAP
jgi:hypothetical protein